MEKKTINVILDFLNQMEIYKVLTAVDFGIYNLLRNDLIIVFEGDNLDKLFEILSSFDDFYIDYLEKRAHFEKSLITNLRDKILVLYKEKIEKQIHD